MTPVELAQLRDLVARERVKRSSKTPSNGRGWSRERLEAGDAALSALRKATARRTPAQKAQTVSAPRAPKMVAPRCVYCGYPCKRGRGKSPSTCPSHYDLPALDPFYIGLRLAA